MSADIPTPFNYGRTSASSDPLFDADDATDGGTLDTAGSDAMGQTKAGGGLPSDQRGCSRGIISGKGGARYYFNATPSAIDFTANDEIIVFAQQANAVNRRQIDTLSNDGVSIKMYSGSDTTSEIREWVLGGEDAATMSRTGIFLFIIDPQSIGTKPDVGTFDPSDVLRYGNFGTQKNVVGSASQWWFWCNFVKMGTEKTSGIIPRIHGVGSSFVDLVDVVQGTTNFTGQEHIYINIAGDVLNILCPCAVGDASQPSPVATTFNDNGLTIISPSHNVANDPRYQMTTKTMRFYLDLRNNSSDTAAFSGTYIWGTAAPFDFSQADAAIVTLSGATFNGMGEFTLGSSVSGSANFRLADSSKVVCIGANLDGSTINGDMNVQGATVTTFTGLTVTGVTNFDSDGTYTMSGGSLHDVTQSDTAITLNLENGATITGTIGAGITVNSPTATLTFVNMTTSTVEIFDDSGVTVSRVSAQSSPYSYQPPAGSTGSWSFVADRVGYAPLRGSFSATGDNATLDADLAQLLKSDNTPQYSGGTYPLVTVVYDLVTPCMCINIADGIVTCQQIMDASEDALLTANGMRWQKEQNSLVRFDALPGVGNILFFGTNIRVKRTSVGDVNSGVSGYISSIDGVVVDGANGGVSYVGGIDISALALEATLTTKASQASVNALPSAVPSAVENADAVWAKTI